MKKKILNFLLLFTLFFHIVHDTVLAEEFTDVKSVHTYVQEQISPSLSCDVSDNHHLFHFMAIIEDAILCPTPLLSKIQLKHKHNAYTPPFQQSTIKPPIV